MSLYKRISSVYIIYRREKIELGIYMAVLSARHGKVREWLLLLTQIWHL